MALLKNIKYPNGTESNYHKIARLSLAKRTNEIIRYETSYDENGALIENTPVKERVENYEMEVYVRSYTSKEIRDTGDSNYLKEYRFYFVVPTELVEGTPVFTVVYNFLKTKPEFEGAEDI